MHPYASSARPVQETYKAWDTILTATGRDQVTYGHANWALHRVRLEDGDHYIGFGRGGSPDIILDKRGRFHFSFSFHGAKQRNIIMRNVPFLGWSWTHSRYQWLVNFDTNVAPWGYSTTNLRDPERPIHYVSEDLLGCRTWGQHRPWCVLEKRADGQWAIAMAKNQMPLPRHTLASDVKYMRQRWEHYEQLVAARYRRARGEPSPVSVRTPTMLNNNQPLPPQQAVEALAALFSVDSPAKTTPLKRPKEAQRDHHMDPAYNL